MSNTNEVSIVNNGIEGAIVVSENDRFVTKKGKDGKFFRSMKYKAYSSVKPETREEKIELYNILNSEEEGNNGLKDYKGVQFEVHNVITRPYDKVNEETGEEEFGALTYLFTEDGTHYVTSSKTVYSNIWDMMEQFGYPDDEDFVPFKVEVVGTKRENGTQISIKLIG